MAATAVTAAGAQDTTSGMLFLPYYNYTNKYSKVLCLQMQMSGAIEMGDGLGIN